MPLGKKDAPSAEPKAERETSGVSSEAKQRDEASARDEPQVTGTASESKDDPQDEPKARGPQSGRASGELTVDEIAELCGASQKVAWRQARLLGLDDRAQLSSENARLLANALREREVVNPYAPGLPD